MPARLPLLALALLAVSAVQGTAQAVGDPEAGVAKALMCTGCHAGTGTRMNKPLIFRIPKIAGQHNEYLVSALKDYKSGTRQNASMKAIAAALSDQDIEDLAAYFASQPWKD